MYIPEFPYSNNQLIFNSDRITLNSKEDSIFMFSSKIINLSSNEGVHVNTNKEIIFNSPKIYLGLNSNEPIPKGNQLYIFIEELLKDLKYVGDQLNGAIDSNGNPITNVQTAGHTLIKSIGRLTELAKRINSKQNYTL